MSSKKNNRSVTLNVSHSHSQIIVSKDNIDTLNNIFKTDYSLDEMKKYQNLSNISRSISGSKYINPFNNNTVLTYQSKHDIKKFYDELNIFNCHIGQLKLFYTLFEFLLLLKKSDHLEDSLIVYIGSAHGFNIYANNIFFPNVSWLLYDPGSFDKRLFNIPNITIKTNKDGFFGLDKIDEIREIQKKTNKKNIAFISDIRLDIDEVSIFGDNELNYLAILALKPIGFMLKFRVPYVIHSLKNIPTDFTFDSLEDYYKRLNKLDLNKENSKNIKGEVLPIKPDFYRYIDGKIYTQLFATPHSAETRLINFSDDGMYEMKYYDMKVYESNMYTFNLTRLFFNYDIEKYLKYLEIMFNEKNISKNYILKSIKYSRTYENVCELILIIKYINSYKKINLDKLTNDEIYNKIIGMYQRIYKLIPDILMKRIRCVS